MVGLSHKTLWTSNLARLLRSAEPRDVWQYVFDSLRADMSITSLCVIHYMGDTMPKVLLNIAGDDPAEKRKTAYLGGAYLLDPFFLATLERKLEGCYSLADLSAADFERSEYFLTFFSSYGLEDELNLFCPLGDGSTAAISLGREIGACKFEKRSQSVLSDCFPFFYDAVRQLVHRHRDQDADILLRAEFHTRIKSAFERMATSVLTHREKTIFDYLLRGYSVKATANRLDISEGTVRIHRHSIYGKLDVKTQTELFALVVEALKLVDPTDNDDPIRRLEQPAADFRNGRRQHRN